jgi:hypothetical protein
MSQTPQPESAEARLSRVTSLPDVLAAGFDAFEAIRITARHYQDEEPGLFAAFMTTADAAVDGREALTIAPSLPLHGGTEPASTVPPDASTGEAADALARLAIAIGDRLTQAATQAGTQGDADACLEAAEAAGRIRELMTR